MPAPKETDPGSPIVSVQRAFAVIEWLADAPDGLPFPQIRDLLGTNQGICFKLLAALETAGYVYRHDETGRYHLSYKVANLGLRKLRHARLLDQSTIVLRALANLAGETAALAVVENEKLIWVLSVAGTHSRDYSLQIDPRRAMRVSLHASATGKAWLSTLPAAFARRLLKAGGMQRHTRATLTTLSAIEAEIALTHQRGFAIAFEESEPGIGGVAAPVMAAHAGAVHSCVGVVSVMAPVQRLSRADLERLGPTVMKAATQLADAWPLHAGTVAELIADPG